MSKSLVAKFLLVDNLSCEREIEKRGKEMRDSLQSTLTENMRERERERERERAS